MGKHRHGFHLTRDQVKVLGAMLDKKYPIYSLRYNPFDGYITVNVELPNGRFRGFFINQEGKLLK